VASCRPASCQGSEGPVSSGVASISRPRPLQNLAEQANSFFSKLGRLTSGCELADRSLSSRVFWLMSHCGSPPSSRSAAPPCRVQTERKSLSLCQEQDRVTAAAVRHGRCDRSGGTSASLSKGMSELITKGDCARHPAAGLPHRWPNQHIHLTRAQPLATCARAGSGHGPSIEDRPRPSSMLFKGLQRTVQGDALCEQR